MLDQSIETLIDLTLAEDIGSGDVTSLYFVPKERVVKAKMKVKAEGVIAGLEIATRVFERIDASIKVTPLVENGAEVSYGDYVMEIEGPARSVLTAERPALNFMQRLSGIATKTRSFVKEVEGTKAQVLDTRKTTPGWRLLEKSAVLAGGGTNHRMGLYDRAMVKDNHLVAENTTEALKTAISQLKKDLPEVEIELEADRLDQVERFLTLKGVDYILLDNMSNEQLQEALVLRGDRTVPAFEASGGVNLETIKGIAETEVEFISVGALTHSAVALDISLDFQEGD